MSRKRCAALVSVGLVGGVLLVLGAGSRRALVRGRSMLPLLSEGDRVLVDPLRYRLTSPRRGDIVLARLPPPSDLYQPSPPLQLKRLVGLPGERIAVAWDCLLVNGEPLDLGRPVVGSSPGEWLLGPDEYFLLSENLAVGTDSRHTGPVRRSDLLGRAWLVYAPQVRRLHEVRHPRG